MGQTGTRAPAALRDTVETGLLTYYPDLYRLAYTYLKNQDDALDAVQESACKAIVSASRLREETSIRAWLCQIVARTCLDMLHVRRRERAVDAVPEEGREDRYSDPGLLACLDILSQRERTVVALRCFQELSLREIGTATGLNENTVKTTLYRGLKKLRDHLTKGEDGHGGKTDRAAEGGV